MTAVAMDEIFRSLTPYRTLPDGLEHLLANLARRLNLSWAELTLIGRQTLTVHRRGRALAMAWSEGAHGGGEPPRQAARSLEGDGVVRLPLAFAAHPLGELSLAWKSEGERRRSAPPWLTTFARHCSYLINRHVVRDWCEHRLGHPLLLVGMSGAMRRLDGLMEHAARSDLPVLLCGEFGTEKLPLAAHIHCGGRRRDGPSYRSIARRP
ncbi:MAG: hypothetical protein ACK4Y4_05240 [Brevundimonas sp.]